jgi:hypothetical protein
MNCSPFQINTPDDLNRAIVQAEAQGSPGWAHLARGLAAGRNAFLPVTPEMSATRFKRFTRMTTDRPTVVLIGDDDGLERGPGGWLLARRAVAWARAVMIHGAGAELAHYEVAIIAAELTGRCLIIECGTATLAAWTALVRAAPHKPETLVIQPHGGAHPIPLARETLH